MTNNRRENLNTYVVNMLPVVTMATIYWYESK